MGEIIKIVCQSCKGSWQCKTGCGIAHAKIEQVAGFYKEEVQNSILEKTGKQQFPLFSFGFWPVICETCQEIVSVPILELSKDKIKYTGTCTKCQSEITGISADAGWFGSDNQKETGNWQGNYRLACPKCQSADLMVEKQGYWD